MEKFYSSKVFLKMAGGGMHPPHPGSAHVHSIHIKMMQVYLRGPYAPENW